MINTPIFLQLLIFFLSFFVLWYSAGLIISVVVDLAKSWRLPQFTISFLILGIFTSLPELMIGTSAVINRDPQIFVGNLLGGVIVLFFLVIPLLAVIGHGVALPRALTFKELAMSLVVILIPTYLSADQVITKWEAVLCIIVYGVLAYILAEEQSVFEKLSTSFQHKNKQKTLIGLAKIGISVILLFAASQVIVSSTEKFALLLGVSPFIISLLLVSFGTNIPELSLVFRGLFEQKQDIALADHLGSAATNTLVFGVLALLYGQKINLPDHFLPRLVFLSLGLLYFFFLIRSGKKLSRIESLTLLVGYGLFIALEISLIG